MRKLRSKVKLFLDRRSRKFPRETAAEVRQGRHKRRLEFESRPSASLLGMLR